MKQATARAASLALGCAAAALVACGGAAGPRGGVARGLLLRADPETRIDPELARRDVAWLADPARTGRGVGTPGNATTVAWLAGRMRVSDLEPAGYDGGSGLEQVFDAPVGARLVGTNALRLSGRDAPLGAWQPFTFSDDGAAEAELVWA